MKGSKRGNANPYRGHGDDSVSYSKDAGFILLDIGYLNVLEMISVISILTDEYPLKHVTRSSAFSILSPISDYSKYDFILTSPIPLVTQGRRKCDNYLLSRDFHQRDYLKSYEKNGIMDHNSVTIWET
jgi:hypothetical protein